MLDIDTEEKMKKFDLLKFWKVGSNNYPNIIDAWSKGKSLFCEFLSLTGWSKIVEYKEEE